MANPSLGTVIGLGLGMVFVGLIFIIFLCYLLGFIVRKFSKNEVTKNENNNSVVDIKDKKEFVAVIAACIAETMNKDVEAIRIKSIKRV